MSHTQNRPLTAFHLEHSDVPTSVTTVPQTVAYVTTFLKHSSCLQFMFKSCTKQPISSKNSHAFYTLNHALTTFHLEHFHVSKPSKNATYVTTFSRTFR